MSAKRRCRGGEEWCGGNDAEEVLRRRGDAAEEKRRCGGDVDEERSGGEK